MLVYSRDDRLLAPKAGLKNSTKELAFPSLMWFPPKVLLFGRNNMRWELRGMTLFQTGTDRLRAAFWSHWLFLFLRVGFFSHFFPLCWTSSPKPSGNWTISHLGGTLGMAGWLEPFRLAQIHIPCSTQGEGRVSHRHGMPVAAGWQDCCYRAVMHRHQHSAVTHDSTMFRLHWSSQTRSPIHREPASGRPSGKPGSGSHDPGVNDS